MNRLLSRLLTAVLIVVVTGCAAPARDPDVSAVTIMTFNVENLFDSVDDPGRNDATYLPIGAKQNAAHIAACNRIEVERWRNDCLYLDWSEAAIDYKLRVLADAIRQVSGGAGPDVIALQEVENRAILERLRTRYLGDLGYGPSILIEGQDQRGIDVAFLSRLPVVGEPVLHPLTVPDFPEREGDTRGVLEATFALPDGGRLTGFSVHFPAPFHPTAMRVRAYEHLNRLREAVPEDRNVFAAGDFNTTSSEIAETDLYALYVRPHWTIVHEIGCEGCPGTHYYARDDRWSFLDMILFSPARSGKTTWRIRANSVALANQTAAQVQPDGTPRRFDIDGPAGVSDHWPLVVTIERTQKQ
jgi:endonuclease/exonuclease/phosphatase family metal-dependent hydrolase